MEPIKFKQSNITLRAPKGQEKSCGSLPVYRDDDQIISCWQLSFKERLRALLIGRIWLGIQGSNTAPVWLCCRKTVFLKRDPDEA